MRPHPEGIDALSRIFLCLSGHFVAPFSVPLPPDRSCRSQPVLFETPAADRQARRRPLPSAAPPSTSAVARLATFVARAGGALVSHDGGVEDHPTLLAGLISRADLVLFPVDCVSHDAAGHIKRACRDVGCRYVPLRSASLASAVAALSTG